MLDDRENPEYIDTMSSDVKNIKYLNCIARFTKQEMKPIAHELIKLYADMKVSHVTTIINVLDMLTSNDKRSRNEGVTMYEKVKAKYETMLPLAERLPKHNTETI